MHRGVSVRPTKPRPLMPRSWGSDPMYNMTGMSVSSSSCPFFAAVGILPGVGTTGVGADNPSMDGAGRFISYTTNFQVQSAPSVSTHHARAL